MSLDTRIVQIAVTHRSYINWDVSRNIKVKDVMFSTRNLIIPYIDIEYQDNLC